MRPFLLFTLYAPLASWGDIAVGESRGSWDRPSRSAVLGLVAAALGVTREDQAAHDALDAGYGFAVRLDAAGAPLADYHTAQTVAESAVKRVRKERGAFSRAALFAAAPDRETILSRRAYRQDAFATAALWARGGARWALGALAAALARPAFVPYAGRKANALGLPLAPEVVEAGTLAAAFAARPLVPRGLADVPAAVRRALAPGAREVAHDPCDADGFASGLDALRRETRRDAGVQRARWQFATRVVEVGLLAGAPGVADAIGGDA